MRRLAQKCLFWLILAISALLVLSSCANGSENNAMPSGNSLITASSDNTPNNSGKTESSTHENDPGETPELIFFDPQKLYD